MFGVNCEGSNFCRGVAKIKKFIWGSHIYKKLLHQDDTKFESDILKKPLVCVQNFVESRRSFFSDSSLFEFWQGFLANPVKPICLLFFGFIAAWLLDDFLIHDSFMSWVILFRLMLASTAAVIALFSGSNLLGGSVFCSKLRCGSLGNVSPKIYRLLGLGFLICGMASYPIMQYIGKVNLLILYAGFFYIRHIANRSPVWSSGFHFFYAYGG